MIREKQIEEMAFDVQQLDFCMHLEPKECDATTCCHCTAEALYNAGYRKQSEVAREIFEELEKILHLRDIGENLNITALYTDYAELKKKYTEADQ